MDWKQLKKEGSEHYKTGGGVEPIDLYLAAGLFRHYAVTSIIKYAFRNRNNEEPVRESDMHKIIDLAQKLIAANHVDDEYKEAEASMLSAAMQNMSIQATYEPQLSTDGIDETAKHEIDKQASVEHMENEVADLMASVRAKYKPANPNTVGNGL